MRKHNMQFSFGATPTVSMRRSKFDLSHGVKTSMSVGTLYPILCQEVLPGDTFRCKISDVVRLTSSYLKPVMDNVFMDTYFFFVPDRILYDKWAEVFGENKNSPYAALRPLPEVPNTTRPQTVVEGSVADYLGLPIGDIPEGLNALPFRAFAEIYNEWFRNENTVDPVHVEHGDWNTVVEALNGQEWSASNYTGLLPKVGKRKDYFTSCLPSPQKGNPVDVSVVDGSFNVPVYAEGGPNGYSGPFHALHFVRGDGQSIAPGGPLGVSSGSGNLMYEPGGTDNSSVSLTVDNLVAQISADSGFSAVSVNDLRTAFALQKMLEKDSRYGTRYREYLLGHFGVSNPDARMQIPEFLGGARLPLNIQTVASTSSPQSGGSSTQLPLASLGAYSHSSEKNHSRFTKSFTEHGFVIAVACIRQLHTYQQGIDRMWFRRKREDYYDPLFANIGEQPVFTAELMVPKSVTNEPKLGEGDVFGYNEAWADYRYKPSKITGQMRTVAKNSLDVYHFGDYYDNPPVLSDEFTDETAMFFDRTVAVPSTSQDNFIVDFWFDFTAYRVMPVYSTPGLIDHH